MFKVIEVAGKRERIVGEYSRREVAEQVCGDMIAAAGRAGLMFAYFIETRD